MGTCSWLRRHEPRAWSGFQRTCVSVIMAGKISVRTVRMARNAILPKSKVAGVVGGDRLGGRIFTAPAVSLYHVSKRLRGVDCPVDQLVAGCASNRLAQAAQIWAGLCRQGRNWWEPRCSTLQQERHTHHGRNSDSTGSQCHNAALGAMEYAGPTDVAFSRCADGLGFLRRLCKNH